MLLGCDLCCTGFKVLGKPEDLGILLEPKWLDGYPCPVPRCGGVQHKAFSKVEHFHELSVSGFYRAVHGCGFGKSAEADPEKVLQLLKSKRIVEAELQPIGQPVRSIIKSILFEDGTLMYLASSNEGACVYLIEEGNDFYEDRRVAPDGDLEDNTSSGAQARYLGPREESGERGLLANTSNAESELRPRDGAASEICPHTTDRPRTGSHGP